MDYLQLIFFVLTVYLSQIFSLVFEEEIVELKNDNYVVVLRKSIHSKISCAHVCMSLASNFRFTDGDCECLCRKEGGLNGMFCDGKMKGSLYKNICEAKTENQLVTKEIMNSIHSRLTLLEAKYKQLEEQNENLQTEVARCAKLDKNNKIEQQILPGRYATYNISDLEWGIRHTAASAACRGSTETGGSGDSANAVYPYVLHESCATTCSKTTHKNCDAQVTINGVLGKATQNYQPVGYFYNYYCGTKWIPRGANEVLSPQVLNLTDKVRYIGYCCCRK